MTRSLQFVLMILSTNITLTSKNSLLTVSLRFVVSLKTVSFLFLSLLIPSYSVSQEVIGFPFNIYLSRRQEE